jgi:outer membrane lipoprotein-sorting protein
MTTRSATGWLRYHAGFMRSIAHASWALIVASTVVLAAQPPASQDAFDRLFARTLAKRESIRSIRARFTETTVSTLLQKPLVSHGTIVAAPPARVLMTYTDPERRTIAIDSKRIVVFWPDRGERETIDIAQMQKRIDQYFTQANLSQLRSMFDITLEADAAVRAADRVDMRPKRRQIRQGLERLQLWIDRESLLLVQMAMAFPGGDTKTIRLDDIEVNVPIAADTFQIRP